LAALPQDSKTKRALQTLLHPEMLGRAFQVLALAKDVDRVAPPLAEPLPVRLVRADPASRSLEFHRATDAVT